MNRLEILHSLPVLAVAVLGTHYLPELGEDDYLAGFVLLVVALAGLFVFFTRSYQGPYRLSYLHQTAWLFALAWLGAYVLGGPGFRFNLALLFAVAALIGTWAHPLHSVYVILALFLSTAIRVANGLTPFLPGLEGGEPVQADYADLVNDIYPVFSVSLFQGLLLVFQRRVAGSPSIPAPRSAPVVPPVSTLVAVATPGMGEEGAPADPRQSRFFSRIYLEKQGEQAMQTIKERLDSVVFFMSRLFRAQTSIGFLLNESKDKLVLTSVVTKSENFDYDYSVAVGKGVVGEAAVKPAGFFTGNMNSFGTRVDYYTVRENINSLMAMPIMHVGEKRLQGLLLVDSEAMRAFSDEHKELMRRFTQIASDLIGSAELSYHMNEAAKRSENLYEISKTLSMGLKPEEVFDALIESLTKAFRHDRLVICTCNSQTGRGMLWKVVGDDMGMDIGREFDVQNQSSVYGSVFRNRQVALLENFRSREGMKRFDWEEPQGLKPSNLLLAPVQDDMKQLWAVVGLESNREGTYSHPERQFLETIMNTVTSALSKAWMYMEMEKQATVDGLTQIANHRKFQDTVNIEMERCRRYQVPLTLLLLDIDHFKQFNDTYGHPVGDLVLQMVAKALEASIRTTDFCARYGGEEFVVLLTQTDEQQAPLLAERIRQAVEALEIRNDDKVLSVTVSIGAAVYPHDAETKQELIDNADKAMYRSKENGRNQVTFFSSFNTRRDPVRKSLGH